MTSDPTSLVTFQNLYCQPQNKYVAMFQDKFGHVDWNHL